MDNQERNDTRYGMPFSTTKRRAIGITTLALLFCASAVFTVVFLSDTPHASAGSNVAATAATTVQTSPDPFASTDVIAHAVYVKDLKTGKVLYEKNANVQLPLASLTKIAMALSVSEVLSPDTVITIPYDTAPLGNPERLAAGQRWLLKNLMGFTLVVSSNDGASIMAAAANSAIRAKYPQAPAQNATIWRMNDLAHALGLDSMYYLNANGLDISTTQSGGYGSAKDVADLVAYAAKEAQSVFAPTSRQSIEFTSIGGVHVVAHNTDAALSAIPGLVMGKTGYTDLAGGNLAVLFNVGPAHPVVAVVLGSTFDGRFVDMKHLVADSLQAVAEGE